VQHCLAIARVIDRVGPRFPLERRLEDAETDGKFHVRDYFDPTDHVYAARDLPDPVPGELIDPGALRSGAATLVVTDSARTA